MLKFFGILIALIPLAACEPSNSPKPGWLELKSYQLTARIKLDAVPQDASGLAYDPGLDALWLLHDDPASLVLLDTQGRLLRRWPLVDINDPEAVELIEIDKQGVRRLVISDERRGQLIELRVDPTRPGLVPVMDPILAELEKKGNKGIEGLTYRDADHAMWLSSESFPQSIMHLSRDGILEERWRSWPWQQPGDYSGLAYVPDTDSLLVLSERSSALLEYNLMGEWMGQLQLSEIERAEGVALASDGRLFITAEPYWLYIFEPAGKNENLKK